MLIERLQDSYRLGDFEEIFEILVSSYGPKKGGVLTEIMTDGSSLLVRGIRQDIAVPGKKHFFKMEISVGPFVRRVPIPVQVDLPSAVARYRSGFLYVTFKKGGSRGTGRRQIAVDKS